jgi:hypothetical protein
MATRADIFEALCRAGMPPSRAETLTREVAESGLVRRGPLGRPRKRGTAFSYSPSELAVFVQTLGALAPADGVGMPRVLAEHRPDPEQTTPSSVDDFDTTLPQWLTMTLEGLSELSAEARKAAYRQADGAFIEFTSEVDNLGEPASTVVTVEWRGGHRIVFRSPETSLREVLREPPPRYLATTTVRLAWTMLLDLTASRKEPEPENESAKIPARISAPLDQPATGSLLRPTETSDTSHGSRESARAPKR